MAHTLIWCLMFSIVIVFIANLSLIFVEYLQVPVEIFGYYQAVIMAAFFIGSMGGAYLIKKLGMLFSKVVGSLAYLIGIFSLALESFFGLDAPLILILSMGVASLGSALAMTIYFTYSMSFMKEQLKGSAMSLVQSIRLLLSSGLVWLAANWFNGSTQPMSFLAICCTVVCLLLYLVLYKKKLHVAVSQGILNI